MQIIKRFVQMGMLIGISSIISACAGNVIDELDTELATDTSIPTETLLPSSTLTPQPTASPTVTLQPSPTVEVLSEDEFNSLSGLLYTIDDAIWTIDSNGQMQQLYDCFGSTRISPDASQSLVNQDMDIWILDHETCTSRNVTNTSGDDEAYENGAVWWPGRPNTILIGYFGGDYAFGVLNEVNVLTGEVKNISEGIAGLPSFSPDGQRFVYEESWERPLIYDVNSGITELEIPKELAKITSPSWSHDGTSIAWRASINDEGTKPHGQSALVVFEGISGEMRILRNYTPLGVDSLPQPAIWSPNDEWLVFHALAENLEESGIWLIPTDESPSYKLPIISSGRMFWSPTSDYLLIASYVRVPDEDSNTYTTEVWLVRTGTWEMQKVEALFGARIIDWR